ncbi:hypothetical protein NLU13_4317 [Sarocladium strictum]|uniref:polynucleotide adenylyltransferase n=1 Tax=Sarocladium strictum TaxID=5046 RepID=A0AA39GIM7_SARSR|nr:hypothetical protein NLU13_4317 [Sarocladium strictum]
MPGGRNRDRRNGDRPRNGGPNGGRRDRGPRQSPPRSFDRGASGATDSWRPGDNGSRDSYRREPRDDHRQTDSYRPSVPQGDFTFRADKPAGIASLPRPQNYPSRDRQFDRRGRGRDGRGGGRGNGRPRWQPPHPSERALLTGATLNIGETTLTDGGAAKFRNIEDLSDDDELEMEISSRSSDSDSDNPDEPSKKRARTEAAPDASAVPKWSNPDPYTALPPPDETSKKKKNFVELIRKARVEEEEAKAASTAKPENFISFDLSEDEDEDQATQADGSRKPSPPYEPPPPLPPGPAPASLPPRPPTGPRDSTASNGHLEPDRTGPLGSRKRTADDEIKPPDYQIKKTNMKASKGTVSPQWMPKKNEEPCPWAIVDHSATRDMAFRLHKEVMDFYEFVKPKKFEQRIRDRLVDNLRQAMRRDGRNFASATVHPFGSFMSGLYLPTADMDLVVCSASFMKGGPPTYLGARSWLYKFQKFLVSQRVADQHSIEVIAHARIPLVKFVDKMTGLRVDVSFENLGGVGAIDTFLEWKKHYPAMPILVTLIKHFLMMRGLNEPVNGGIGGFSVICLVVSMLQLMPQVQSRSLVPEHHLGEMLLEFFELYGRRFRYQNVAIRLTSSPGYVRKNNVTSLTYKNTDRLSIIDPCNSTNDISGGSSNTSVIMSRFREAYDMLKERMAEVAQNPDKGGILDVLMKGDYSSFRKQRDFLRHVHEKSIGPCDD